MSAGSRGAEARQLAGDAVKPVGPCWRVVCTWRADGLDWSHIAHDSTDRQGAWRAFHAECRRSHPGAEELQVDLLEHAARGGRVLESWSEAWGTAAYAEVVPDKSRAAAEVRKLGTILRAPEAEEAS